MSGPTPRAVRATVLAALLATPAAASEGWVRVRSPHFEVLSDAGRVPAVEAARRLERLRDALRLVLPAREEARRPITLLVLGSRGRFSGLVPREHRRPDTVAAFFQGGGERDYAVLHLSPERTRPFEAAEHEYAHLVLNASLPAQPVWVAEGLAEVFSDAVLDGEEARLGAGRPEHEERLARQPRLSLETLIGIGHDSPEYLGEARSDALYATSWALSRWVIHRRGLQGLLSFLGALSEGREPGAAFAEAIGDLAEAETTLLEPPPAPLFRVSLEEPSDPPSSVDLPATADVEQRLGDLLLQGGHVKRARARFERALEADPDHVPSRASLAELLVRQGRWQDAGRELERALAAAPDDPIVVLRRARLRFAEAAARGEPLPSEVEEGLVGDLEEALVRAPRLHEAAVLLAQLRPEPHRHRIAQLQPLFDQQPERIEVAQVLSHLHFKDRNLAAARRVLERAREAARNPAYRYLCDHLLARLEGFEAVTAEVRGRLVDLECRSDGSLRFTIAADPATLRLDAASPRSFFVHGDRDGSREQELLCGAQDRRLVVRYWRGGSVDPGVSGQVVWLSVDASPR